jgi:trehalose synthase
VITLPVLLGKRRLGEYAAVTSAEALMALRWRAQPLAGLRVLHLSASPFGSAVAEMLSALVPLQRELGILADWQVAHELPRICTQFYEGLRGDDVRWGWKERAAWFRMAHASAGTIPRGYDVVVAHDPQALALFRAVPGADRARWIWHCHLDTRAANPEFWSDLSRTLEGYAAALFPSARLTRTDVPVPHIGIARPGLDPWSLRNIPLSRGVVESVLAGFGIDPQRPILAQFAPIDHRFAPLGALGTYWLVRRHVPAVQIVLAEVGQTDPERRRSGVDQIAEAAAGDPDIHLITNDVELGPTEINALERACTVALQMAVPRGFGWGLAECLWKERPGIVGQHGELPDQVGDAGYVVDAAPAARDAVLRLLSDPVRAAQLGQAGHDRVVNEFLITGTASDYVDLLREVAVDAAPSLGRLGW